jgi:uncharacterized protein
MDRDTVITRLKSLETRLRSLGVAALYLFGSHARGEARPDSDLDVCLDFDPATPRSLQTLIAPYQVLEEQFPDTAIGYGERQGLSPYIRTEVEQQAVRIF